MKTDTTPDLSGCKVQSVFHNWLSKTPLELPYTWDSQLTRSSLVEIFLLLISAQIVQSASSNKKKATDLHHQHTYPITNPRDFIIFPYARL